MCVLFCRTCLERNNSSLRILCWSGLLPMFAHTEYLMTFAATYSFFCVVLMRGTWIWYVLVTFTSWVIVNSNTVLTVYRCSDCPLHVIRKKIMLPSSYWVWMNICPWYRCSCPVWMDRINLLKCYWKAKIHYFRSVGRSG